MKKYIYIILVVVLVSCGNDEPIKQEMKVGGYAQGTTYSITYISEDGVDHQRAIDSLLIEVDNSLSTYQNKSIISKFNQSKNSFEVDDMFVDVFTRAKIVHYETEGQFDPTVAPIVNAWGFGFENSEDLDSLIIDSLLQFVGLDSVTRKFYKLQKKEGVMLDFNAIAQGYTVDVLGNLLESHGINNYLVEVGGELKAKGVNMQDTLWRVGIDRPLADLKERELEAIVHLNNRSLATSGNYRKFYEKDGKKYSHTINPKTGYPVEHNLLSATVIAKECAFADAYATALMVMGLEQSKEFLKQHKELEALLIFSNDSGELETFTTENLTKNIELNPDKN
jgi:thiamine biosynthesis lipoprotein